METMEATATTETQETTDAIPLHTGNICLDDFEPIKDPLDILKDRRIALGLTQQEVADAAHINLRRYQRYEDKEVDFRKAPFEVGMSIATVLHLKIQEIFPQYRV